MSDEHLISDLRHNHDAINREWGQTIYSRAIDEIERLRAAIPPGIVFARCARCGGWTIICNEFQLCGCTFAIGSLFTSKDEEAVAAGGGE